MPDIKMLIYLISHNVKTYLSQYLEYVMSCLSPNPPQTKYKILTPTAGGDPQQSSTHIVIVVTTGYLDHRAWYGTKMTFSLTHWGAWYGTKMTFSLTHWGRGKIAAISQMTLWNAFFRMKMLEFGLKFHWSLFIRVQLTIFQHWFR